ncbi:amidohydrolase family protein [Novosphingobium sp. MMS21-SN21R]|uniref:amidohydrolase family protein n=1 Tax=Novosphingobium sp. MMS21-SN21R TaxID=2969298 RepID=UPI002884E6E4|nr:amidohydrolase family protein [Novosphingobium sp. MMS21-SN21R]MDT0506686.1 amidohydrolase family protein [Novosphingobium sp. MMS21-SN21R]
MRFRLIVAAALATAATPLCAKPVEYRMISDEADIGHYIVDQQGSTISVDYDIKQNGRGPTIRETVTLGNDGAPADWKITGRTTFGNAVAERFSRTSSGASWTDLAGKGTIKGKEAPRYYIAQNGSVIDISLLAKALLKAPGMAMPVAPGGTATMVAKGTQAFYGADGKLDVTTYELSGLALDPNYIALDSSGDLFAVASADSVLVRKGYEKVAAEPLRILAERLGAERFTTLQKENARRYAGPVRIRNVRLFDPAAKALTEPRDVVVFGNRITEIAATGSVATRGETNIDGAGGTLVPGLYEMHAHLGQDAALLNVLAGITSVRDMGNNDEVLDKLVARIDAGELAGPRVTRSGFIEGESKFSARNGTVVATQDEAIAAVRKYAARGFWQAKLYNSMSPAWAPVVVSEAHRLGMRVAGHVPAFSNADAMIAAGFDEITHVNQLMLGWVLNPDEDTRTLFRFTAMRRFPSLDVNSAKVQATLDSMVAHHVAHEPTIGIHELGLTALDGRPNPGAVDYIDHMPPEEQRQLKQALFGTDTPQQRAEYVAAYAKVLETLTAMNAKGILLIPGTDMGGAFTYHRELELFTKVGMTPAQVLSRATLEMAQYLHQDQQLGSLERGKLADFFLVPGDPTEDLKAIKAIAMVVKDGAFYFPAEIYPKLGIRPFTPAPKVEMVK